VSKELPLPALMQDDFCDDHDAEATFSFLELP